VSEAQDAVLRALLAKPALRERLGPRLPAAEQLLAALADRREPGRTCAAREARD